jgi:signal transduction histidine kinase
MGNQSEFHIPHSKFKMSLRLRLFLSHALVIVIGLVVLFVALLLLLRQVETRRLQRQLGNTAAAVMRFGRGMPLNDPGQPRMFDRLRRFSMDQRARVLLLDANGAITFDSAPPPAGNMEGARIPLNNTIATSSIAPENSAVGEFNDPAGQRWMYAAVPVASNANNTSASWLALAQPADGGPLANMADELGMPLLQALLIALVISAVVAALVARSIARPIQQVAAGAQAFAKGDYSQRVPMRGPSEVQQLAGDFNDMATQVQSARQIERDFVANISHELKTPLTSIQGFAQALRDDDVTDDAGRQRAAQIIFAEADRMKLMVNELLDSARLESGELRMNFSVLRMNEIVQTCIYQMQPRADAAGVTIDANLANELPAITADGDRLLQVLTNLLDNALKHTPSGGNIIVETRTAQRSVNAKAGQPGVEISVSDNGAGIPPEDLPHIFERFYQADKSRSAGGSGLGLAICKQIVEAHAGQISAQSALGMGTRVMVWLPAGDAEKGRWGER